MLKVSRFLVYRIGYLRFWVFCQQMSGNLVVNVIKNVHSGVCFELSVPYCKLI